MSDIAAQPSSNESHQSTRTPGPWTFEPSTEHTFPFVLMGDDVIEVQTDSDADARLISAAPELLAALRQYVACDSIKGDGLARMAQAAIEKATGGSFAGSGDRKALDDAAT